MKEGCVMQITGTTKNLGVMGWPIAHSLSPIIQNAAIAAAGLDYVYMALPVEPEDLEAAVIGLRVSHFRGFNVTIPHKQSILHCLEEVDDDAAIIGAVNTVAIDEDFLITGYNTDVTGFLMGLEEKAFDPRGKNVVILGAGGAAHAVLWGLVKRGAARVTLAVRNPEKAQKVVAHFAPHVTETELRVVDWTASAYRGVLSAADLLVNTTPLGMLPKLDGMPPVDWEALRREALVYDVIYTPAETRLLREAREHGHDIQNGETMLVGQGAASFELWTGVKPDFEVMRKALRQALEERNKKRPLAAFCIS